MAEVNIKVRINVESMKSKSGKMIEFEGTGSQTILDFRVKLSKKDSDLSDIGKWGLTMDNVYLQDSKTLSQCQVTSGKELKVDKVPMSSLQTALQPDMITRVEAESDAEEHKSCIVMPCGHYITPEELTKFVRSTYKVVGSPIVRCPFVDKSVAPSARLPCGKIWEFTDITDRGSLSKSQLKEFETAVNSLSCRNAGDKCCPHCHQFGRRGSDVKINRVQCAHCKKEFCWACCSAWIPSSPSGCGNAGCNGKDWRLRVLETCDKKVCQHVTSECPSIRACPKCGTMLSHSEGCKHMACVCGTEFCMLCLSVKTGGAFPTSCGRYSTNCSVAPCQTAIPSK